MRTPKELKDLWICVRKIFHLSFDAGEIPSQTMDKIIDEIGIDAVVEVFAAVAQIKEHDGRIYGKNREWTNSITVNPDALTWGPGTFNEFRSAGLDDIHTAHVDQLITELRKRVSEN